MWKQNKQTDHGFLTSACKAISIKSFHANASVVDTFGIDVALFTYIHCKKKKVELQ